MIVNLPYGKTKIAVDFPDNKTTIIKPKSVDILPDEKIAIQNGLRNPIGTPPLREMVNPDDSVAIVFSDITRPMPNDRVLPVLLEEIKSVPKNQIVLINGLGTHRPNTDEELEELLGPQIIDQYQIEQHDCYNQDSLKFIGESTRGNSIWINRTYMESSVKILTGFIEPHLFAGFSGGPKAVLPAIAGAETIFSNHGSDQIGHPNSGFMFSEGNPIWDEMLEVAGMTNPTFILNVTLTFDRQINGVYAGDLRQAHFKGTEYLNQTALTEVDGYFDIAVVSVGGYPLDINMYQSIKGIRAAANIVNKGGAIILVSECLEGLPAYGEYGEIMRINDTPEELLALVHSPGHMMQDQWDAQIQAQICKDKSLYIYSDGLTDEEISMVFGKPCRNMNDTIDMLLEVNGPEAQIAVLPEGPLTIPFIRNE